MIQSIKTPITYWGGKQMMVTKLLPLFPVHRLYCEPFAGGAALFWAKEPSIVEVLNDLNSEVSNFYDQLRDNFTEFQHHVHYSLHSRSAYLDALHIYKRPTMFTPVKRAWAFWVLTNQGWGGAIGTWGYGVSDSKSEMRLVRKKEAFDSLLTERLKSVQIECNDALKVIQSRDREDSFFYIDPPYFNADMGHYEGYKESDFIALLDVLSKLKGKFLLSSYASPVLSDYAQRNGWFTKVFEMPLSAAKGKRKREVVTANFAI